MHDFLLGRQHDQEDGDPCLYLIRNPKVLDCVSSDVSFRYAPESVTILRGKIRIKEEYVKSKMTSRSRL